MSQTTDNFGLFETLRVRRGRVEELERHQSRLDASCRRHWQVAAPDLFAAVQELEDPTASAAGGVAGDHVPDRLLRLMCRLRDGAARIEDSAWRIPMPPPARIAVRLAKAPRAGIAADWCDKLWPRDATWQAPTEAVFETLLHVPAGELLEGTRSNLFVRLGGRWLTPPLEGGLVPGIVRSRVTEVAAAVGIDVEVARVRVESLAGCDGLVLTGTGMGLVSVQVLEGRVLDSVAGREFVERCAPPVQDLRRRSARRLASAGPGMVGA